MSPAPRQRSADDRPKDQPRKWSQRCAHDPSMSAQALASSVPSMPPHASHSTSISAPSVRHSRSPGSSPSPGPTSRSEFGVLTPASRSPVPGFPSSRSSNPWSPSPTEPSAPRSPRRFPSGNLSQRPSTAPHSPILSPGTGADSAQNDRHTRSHSRIAVSLKNLLSKPTVPSPSRFSTNSSMTTPSESEASSSSFYAPLPSANWPITPRKLRPPDLQIPGTVAPAIQCPDRTSDTLIDAHRRYASEAAQKIYTSGTASVPPTSQESLDASLSNAPPPPLRGRELKTRNVLRRRPSGSAKLFKGRERGMSSPRPHDGDLDRLRLPPKEGLSRKPGMPFPLTPASAVVEAYKQQELRRDDAPDISKLSIDDVMSSSASQGGAYDQDHSTHSPTPYYPIFGSSSSRRAQIGSLDDRWSRPEADRSTRTASRATPSHQPSLSDSIGRSLTRKVSTRWRKVRAGSIIPEGSPSRSTGHSKARPSLQELWGTDKLSMRSTGRSMDDVPPGDGAWTSPIASHIRSGSDRGDGSDGGKLWRLMRRISTGGLRDRFQSEKIVPPVPAIPKELLGRVNPSEPNEPLDPPSSSSRDKSHPRPSTASKNITVARPSFATSPSPNSSDVASTQFFQKNYSARSSVSSYGEAVIPSRVPDIVFDQHIIAPLEQLRLGDGCEPGASFVPVPPSPRRSTSVPVGLRTTEDVESVDCVPLPSPRHQTYFGDPPSCGSSRPSSLSASASGSPHASYQGHGLVLTRSRLADGIVSLSPPPRPPRDSKRRGEGSVASSPSHSMVVRPADSVGGSSGTRQIGRTPSTQSNMTARLDSPEPVRSRDRDQDTSLHASQQLTFRELEGRRRPPLSEREKADIWDELLARSDRAGGTLHINGAEELMSDSMRFSTFSEV